MAALRTVRVFVSSPGDVELERRRVDVVAERLNGLYPNAVRIEVIRWETKFYTADKSFQVQIPEAKDCDIVIGIFWARLGSVLPPAFPKMPDGTPYPSGTAYEVLSAIEKKRGLEKAREESGKAPDQPNTDVYIFQKKTPPFPAPRDENDLALFDAQWKLLKGFFERWFRSNDGQFLAAFHGFSTTDQFEEQVEKLLQNWLAEHVLKTRALTWPVATLGSPFRGLDQFDAWHAPVFFGRTADIVRATDRLKVAARAGLEDAGGDHDAAADAHDATETAKPKCAYLLVVGASGCGKSSFVHAGIVPRLVTPGFVREVDGWRVAIMGKGTESSPFDSLAQALFSQGTQNPAENGSPYPALPELADGDHSAPAELAALWRDGSLSSKPVERALDRASAALQEIHKSEKPPQVGLVLVVDQLDDLFVSDQVKPHRSQFAALLAKLAATGRVWIVTSLRASLYEQYLSDTAFKALKDDGAYYDLAAPGPGELAEIVRKPAEAAELLFEKNDAGVGLDEKLLADAADPDTLPLLQFTLQMLFKSRREIEGQSWLTFDAYKALGGVDGAIDRTAEAALEPLEKAEQEALPRLLRQLVKSAGYSSVTSGRMAMVVQTIPLAEAERTEAAKKLVQALVGARILTLEQDGKVATIRVTHQRALESWKRARGLVEADADFHRILGEVNDQYTRWNRHGRKRELLLPKGLPLAEAESIVARFGDEVPAELQQYIRTSGRWARLRQRLIALSAMVFAGVAMAAIFYWHQAQKSLVAATGAIGALVQGISEVVRPLAQLDTVEQLVTQARIAINQFDGASRDDAIRTQQGRTYLLLADIDLDRGDVKQMRSDAQQAFGLLDQLSSDGDPETRLYRADSERFIGLSYFESSDRENARKQYEQGIGDLKKLLDLKLNPDLLWHVQRSLANLYQEEGDVLLFKYSQPAEALGAFDQCLDLRDTLAKTGHIGPAFSHDIAWALNKHGDVQVKLGNDDAALQWFTRAKTGLDALGDHLWDNVVWAFDLALVYNNIGLIQLRAGKLEPAIAAFDQAEPIIKRVVEYDPQNLSRRSALSWTSFNRSDALFRSARETKDSDRLRQARDGFLESNNSTRKDAEQATLVSRVQLGLWRGQAYINAIDATMIDWSGDHLRAAQGFITAAKVIIDEYLPHADEFPRRDYIAEGCEYLEWAGIAYLDGGAPADGRRLLQQALDMAKQYRSILGDGAFTPLQARIEGELAKAN